MKKLKYLIVVVLLASVTACDILDVSPRGQVRQKELFETEDGFKQALIGAYIRMASSDLYGANTSFYVPDVLTGIFASRNVSTKPADTPLAKWEFDNKYVEAVLSKIWNSYYTTIAELNNILDNIDEKKDMFQYGNYELIKGEALGLRAFLHLDLLRFFGPSPVDAKAQGTIRALPYSEEFSVDPNKFISIAYNEYIAKIIRDLNAAEGYLAKDPFINATIEQIQFAQINYDGKPEDTWQHKRQQRFNYYAVKATKARYYDWIGDKENALKYAYEIIDAQKFHLSGASDFSGTNVYGDEKGYVYFSEQIFSVHNPNHQKTVEEFFISSNPRLTQGPLSISELYGSSLDLRNLANTYWAEIEHASFGLVNHFRKYGGSQSVVSPNKVPLLRLAEMYFIAMQNLPLGDSRIMELYDFYVDKRVANLSPKFGFDTEDSRQREIVWETIKDFIGEGQAFFVYKKYNFDTFLWPDSSREVPEKYRDFKLPIPKTQNAFEPR